MLQATAQALPPRVHPDKSRMLDLGPGADGFDFLGFHHRMVRSLKYGKVYCHRWPSRRAMTSVRTKVKAMTAPRDRRKWPMEALVKELNPVLRVRVLGISHQRVAQQLKAGGGTRRRVLARDLRPPTAK